ncbi:probably inactive leucine-rich repeat receptor-like protein kinase At5g06940 [Arachis ipaensis]|uniref:probably inactive leucine-rich repeat receptor-like protein kinase At5g06940 n=1 Tax=Arachis ipaensis TaxID=130454 RepID=UPI0007AFD759|nr:probably inactive leucine-rich repeat receptor-like protein kinase At5g06940 [Arachis ipaensis]
MAISCTCIIILMLVPLVFVGITTNAGTHKLSPLDQEANAMLSISKELWSNQHKNVSNRCNWPGVNCNKAGSITLLSPPTPSNFTLEFMTQLCFLKLNFSVFQNLVHLDLSEMGLCEFPKLSGLKKLQHLNLSYNYLGGELPFTLLENLTQLLVLDISNNYIISGTIPQELIKLERLVTLDLSANAFSEAGEFMSTLTKPSTQQLLVKDVLDPRIPLPKSRKDMQDVVHVVKLALACLSSDPKSRPSMQDVANELSASKASMNSSFFDVSIYQLMH